MNLHCDERIFLGKSVSLPQTCLASGEVEVAMVLNKQKNTSPPEVHHKKSVLRSPQKGSVPFCGILGRIIASLLRLNDRSVKRLLSQGGMTNSLSTIQ